MTLTGLDTPPTTALLDFLQTVSTFSSFLLACNIILGSKLLFVGTRIGEIRKSFLLVIIHIAVEFKRQVD